MSERKSINKYYPPDYDPSLNKKKKKNSNDKKSVTIRLMLPFSVKCLNCGEFIAKSRKFNGKKETLKEKYLDKVKIYRFTIRCSRCAHGIMFKTDPKSSDYILEAGAKKVFSLTEDKRNNTILNEDLNENETIDETLERLAREQDEEQNKEELDKLQKIEDKLTILQRQQENNEEVLQLKKMNNIKMNNIEKVLDKKISVDTNEINQIVNAKFKESEDLIINSKLLKSHSNTNNSDIASTTKNGQIHNVRELVMKKKLILKKPNKKNNLGIIKKRK